MEDLVAGFHIGEVRAVEQIGHESEKAVGELVPEQNAGWGRIKKARTIHNARAPVADGLEQRVIILRVVFEIGILDDDHIAAGMLQAGADGGAFSAVGGMRIDYNERIVNGAQDGLGAIRRAIVNEENLLHQIGLFHLIVGGEDGGFLVIDRDDNADFHMKDYK